MSTLLLAALAAAGLSFTAPSLPVVELEPALGQASGRDGGKKRKDEEKEEDYARLLKPAAALIS